MRAGGSFLITRLLRIRGGIMAADTHRTAAEAATMERIVQCVPNFSEGRDPTVIRKITEVIEAVSGVRLLDNAANAD